jgi:hypothetical protein
MGEILPIERVENRIFLIRGQKVMLDRDLAQLYGVLTKRLNEAVRRNAERFPEEFMFQLSKQEKSELVANCDRFPTLKHSTSLPYAFTEHGVAMLSSVLNSEQAIRVNIMIIKTFVRLRQTLALHQELANKFRELENRVDGHESAILQLVEDIKRIVQFEEKPTRRIGFRPNNE